MIKITQREQSGVNGITLELAKAHMRVSDDTDDALITSLIDQARTSIEDYTDRSLVGLDITLLVSARESMVLLYEPINGDTLTVLDIDEDAVEFTYDGLELVFDEEVTNTLRISYSTFTDITQGLTLGWLEVIAFLYDNRGDVTLAEFLSTNKNIELAKQKIWI